MDKILALNKCLENTGSFSLAELEQILLHCTEHKLKKDEYLLRPGVVCNSISFMLEGACYQFSPGESGERIIELYADYDCVVNPSSFFFQQPSGEFIRAFTDCRLLTLSINALHVLVGLSPVFFQLGKILQPGWFRVGFFDQAMSPKEKYNYLMENKPQFLQVFPLKLIASYLKITPETLSRVRAAV